MKNWNRAQEKRRVRVPERRALSSGNDVHRRRRALFAVCRRIAPVVRARQCVRPHERITHASADGPRARPEENAAADAPSVARVWHGACSIFLHSNLRSAGMRVIILWLLGVPLSVLILLMLFGVL
ncbi:MAG TPA: hypothetical protein VIL43_06745 [Burkholderiales bacterium]